MKYFLFSCYPYESSGANDCRGVFNTIEEARNYFSNSKDDFGDHEYIIQIYSLNLDTNEFRKEEYLETEYDYKNKEIKWISCHL